MADSETTAEVHPRELAELAVAIAHEAAALVRSHAGRAEVAATKTSEIDVVARG
jgi:hypothetical protein